MALVVHKNGVLHKNAFCGIKKCHNFLTKCLFELIISPKVLELCPPAIETLKTAHSSTLIFDLI